jgi:hypothetical protein
VTGDDDDSDGDGGGNDDDNRLLGHTNATRILCCFKQPQTSRNFFRVTQSKQKTQ